MLAIGARIEKTVGHAWDPGSAVGDVVFVVDGSYSMGWEGDAVTPHARAVGWIHKFLEELGPGDTVSLIDAREQPKSMLDSPTHDFAEIRSTRRSSHISRILLSTDFGLRRCMFSLSASMYIPSGYTEWSSTKISSSIESSTLTIRR